MGSHSRLRWYGDRIEDRERAGAVAGLTVATEHLLAASRAVVPIEEATLERSGAADVDPGALKGSVSYDTVYAARQHEELTWRHDPGRTAKYLEGPLDEQDAVLRGLIAASVRRSLRG